MPTKFYTLYGNSVHGIKVTWGNDPTVTGDKTLTIDFELNMYAAKPTFGIEGNAPVTVGGVSVNPEPWTTAGWNTATNTGGTQVMKTWDFLFIWKNPVTGGYPINDGFCAQMVAGIGTDNAVPNLKF